MDEICALLVSMGFLERKEKGVLSALDAFEFNKAGLFKFNVPRNDLIAYLCLKSSLKVAAGPPCLRCLSALVLLRSSVALLRLAPATRSIMDFQPLAFAGQMMFLESILFKRVELREVNFWLKGDPSRRPEKAAHLLELTLFVNRMSNWVATEIVMTPNLKKRQQVLLRLIAVAQHCYTMVRCSSSSPPPLSVIHGTDDDDG